MTDRPSQKQPAPLVPAAILLAGGVALGRWLAWPIGLWWLGLLISAGAAAALSRRGHLIPAARVALGLALLSAGAALMVLDDRHVSSADPAGMLRNQPSLLTTVTGRVVGPVELVSPPSRLYSPYDRPPATQFVLAVEQALGPAGGVECRGRVSVRIGEPMLALAPGQRVRIAGRLSRIPGPSNPGGYDRRVNARRKRTFAHLTANVAEAVTVIDPGPPRPIRAVRRFLHRRAAEMLGPQMDLPDRQLVRAMVLGQRGPDLRAVNDAMIRAGVAHFLSVSGFHLAVLLGLIFALARLMRLSRQASAGLVLAGLALFLLAAQPRLPLLRSALMASAICLAILLGRSASSANLLAAAAMVLLAIKPGELFQPGFQLSFGIVAGLLALHQPMRRLLFGRWLRRQGLTVRRNRTARQIALDRAGAWLSHLVAGSVTAWIVAAPLVAYHFGLFSPLAAVNSLLMLPPVAATLAIGYGQLLLGPIAPNLSGQMDAILAPTTDVLTALAHALGSLPGAAWDVKPMPAWAPMLLLSAIGVAGMRARMKLSRAWATVGLGGALLAVMVATQAPAPRQDRAELVILDVGAGMCSMLRCPSGRTVLLDAGSLEGFDPFPSAIAPMLRHRRWADPSAAFVSHANTDHFNALPTMLAERPPEQCFLSSHFNHPASESPAGAFLMEDLAAAGVEVHRLGRGDRIALDERTSVTVLWPPGPDAGWELPTENDRSLVLRIDCDGVGVLLPGDIEHAPQWLLANWPGEALRADVLVLPHHGGYTEALSAFVAAVDPQIVIRSSDYRTGGAALQIPALTHNRQFLSTDRDGAITVRFGRGQAEAKGH